MKFLALTLIVLALVSCNRDPNYRKKMFMQSGNTYFQRGRYKEASIFYRKALAQDRKYGDAYYHLALTSLKLGETANAVPYLRRAVELLPDGTPDAIDAKARLAGILIYASQTTKVEAARKPLLDEAEQIAHGLLARDPNSLPGHKLTADLLVVESQDLAAKQDTAASRQALDKAIAELRKSLQIKPGDPAASMELAKALARRGDIAEAEQLYQSILDRDKASVAAYSELYMLDLAQRRVAEGEALLKKAIANNPKNYGLQTLLAAHYFQTGNRAEMAKILDNLTAHSKEFEQAYFTAGDFYSRIGDGDQAIRQYEQGIAHDTKRKVDYQKRIIEVLTRQGKTAQAYEKVREILKEHPNDSEARGLQGSFLLEAGDIDRAIVELQSLAAAQPNNFVARFNLGRAFVAKQDYQQARQQYEAALKLKPDYAQARLALAQLELSRGDNQAALSNSEAVEKISPNSTAAKLVESASMMRMGRYADSRAILTAILAANPINSDALIELGVLNLFEKKYKEAGDAFRKSYEVNPGNIRGLMGQAQAYFLQRQPELALKLIVAESQKYPTRLDMKFELANVEASMGQYDKALAGYTALLEKFKNNPRQQGDLYTRIGDVYAQQKDLPHAIEAMKKAQELQPGNVTVLNRLAILLSSAGQSAEARKVLELTIRSDATNPVALNNLAYLIADTDGNLDEAMRLANKAKQLLPGSLGVSDTIGWIYLKKNLSDNAIEVFRGLVAQAPESPTYHYHYALALLQAGERKQAKKECQAALERRPDKQEQDRIHELLDKIG